jgi:thiamine pyrophosphokinase
MRVTAERTVLLFTGGDPVDAALASRLPPDAYVIAADSGLEQAALLERRVDLVVGDLDSVHPRTLEAAIAAGAAVERHPEAKDETDLELGLLAAVARGATRVVVAGGHGGRVDHFIANALLLASPRFAGLEVEAFVGSARMAVVRGHVTLMAEPGDLVSLLALGGPAEGVRTCGLQFPLSGERLDVGSTRGVSNVFVGARATVEVGSGTLLVVQPGGGA